MGRRCEFPRLTDEEIAEWRAFNDANRDIRRRILCGLGTPVSYEPGSRRPSLHHKDMSDEDIVALARSDSEYAEWARWACTEWDLNY